MEHQDNKPTPTPTEPYAPTDLEARYQDLALRMAVFPGDPRVNEPSLSLGRLPTNLPLEIPVPPQTQIVGSLVRSQQHADIALDSSLTADAILEFYTQRLSADGWNKIAPMGQFSGGFMQPFQRGVGATFCRGSRGPALSVRIFEGKNGLNEVRINYNADSRNSPCDMGRQRGTMMHEGPIPSLAPPPSAELMSGGSSGGGSNNWHTSAGLETDLDLGTLASHYTAQLEKAGWQRHDGGQAGPTVWSNWQLKDKEGEPWHGTFFILKDTLWPRQHFLYLKVDLDDDQNPSGGWNSDIVRVGF